jgi:hypothetical protein
MKAHAIGAATTLALLLVACGGPQFAEDRGAPVRPETHAEVTLASAYADDFAPTPLLEDDLKTYGYASRDLDDLGSDLAAIGRTLESLNANAEAGELEDVSRDATALMTLAGALESSASKSAGRLSGLGPLDRDLRAAWVDGIEAFSDTATYASTASEVADVALSFDLGALRHGAMAMEGTTNDLANSYSTLTKELERWALENPDPAAAAVARYGD